MEKDLKRILAKNLAKKAKIPLKEANHRVKLWLNDVNSQEFKVIGAIFDSMREYGDLCVRKENVKKVNESEEQGTKEDTKDNKGK